MLEEFHDDDDPKIPADNVAACFFFCLHDRSETLETQVNDPKLDDNEEANVCWPCIAKCENGDFSCKTPG